MNPIEKLLSFRDRLTGLSRVNRRLQQTLQELAETQQQLARVLLVVEHIKYETAQQVRISRAAPNTRKSAASTACGNSNAEGALDSISPGSHDIPDIGFLVHSMELLNHFRCVWELLPAGAFDVILHGGNEECDEIRREVDALGYRTVMSLTLLNAQVRYRHLVSNHPVTVEGQSLIKRLGEKNIRFMYSAGKTGWNLREWNELYDLILCFGPYHAGLLAKASNAVIVQMGYPRFDRLFTEAFDQSELQRRFRCNPAKKTVVWLPTWKTLSSVGLFDQAISALMDQYNVVIKLHPLMPADEPERVAALERHTYTCVIKDATDNLPLYALADFLLCDYGGPALAGIYADKNLLLLNVPGAASDELTGYDSPDISIRESIVNVDPDKAENLRSILGNSSAWAMQKPERQRLRNLFFAPYPGFSSTVAASALLHLDDILARSMQETRDETAKLKERLA